MTNNNNKEEEDIADGRGLYFGPALNKMWLTTKPDNDFLKKEIELMLKQRLCWCQKLVEFLMQKSRRMADDELWKKL